MKNVIKYSVSLLLFCFCMQGIASDKRIDVLFQKTYHVLASNYDSAIVYSDSIIQLAGKSNDKHALAEALKNKGAAYYSKGNYPQTIAFYQQALKLSETEHYNDLLFSIYNLYGTYYKKQNNLKSAQEQFSNAFDLAVHLNDSLQIANSLGDIGLVYELQNNWDKAEECFQKALDIHQKKNYLLGASYALSFLAEVKAYRNQFDEAVALFMQALELKKALSDTSGMAMMVNNIGEVYLAKGDKEKALNYFFQSIEYSKRINYSDLLGYTYKMISDVFKEQKNFEKAYEYYQLSVNIKESIYNEKNARIVNEMEARYQSEKKQLRIDNLNKENEIIEVKIEKQSITTRFLYMATGLLLLIIVIVLISYRNKKKANKIIAEQKTEVEHQRDLIEAKSQEVTDSIHYAKRIQNALLASNGILNKHLTPAISEAEGIYSASDYFVLYKPKDIVSGDFYWAGVSGGKFVMITADCTGHGVPGAFMSLLNIAYLNEAVTDKKIESPEKILEHVRRQIVSSLNPNGAERESADGMDAVLCVFDFKGLWLRFACANNPLWIIRKKEFIEFKPDKFPVGNHYGEQKTFTLNTIGLRKGDIVYTFTDGYADQFGGEKGKKFKYKNLQQLLLANCDKPMPEQKDILEKTIESWRGDLEQVDDILVIGIKI